ncbi:hypothetical protein K435DRAFT_837053, partial [Dendrothele bispora CBS 962.96]
MQVFPVSTSRLIKASGSQYRYQLYNISESLRVCPVYADSSSGPQYAPIWTSTVYINNRQYGTG